MTKILGGAFMKGKPSNKNQRKRKKDSSLSSRTVDSVGIPVASVFGCAVGLATATCLVLLCSVICLFSSDPDKLISPLSFVIMSISFLTAGFAASKKKRAALPCGLFSGGLMTAMCCLVALCLDDSLSMGLSLPVSLLIRLTLIGVSAIGAMIGVNTGGKRNRKR
jgi:putative membrane protein (TIGR04086 family)